MTEPAHIALGAFNLLRPLGRGGMGVVWLGEHREDGAEVAVKVITDEGARQARFRAAFRNEVRAVAGLCHPGVVQVFDYGLIDMAAAEASKGRLEADSPYLVMERLEANPLSRRPRSFAELRTVLQAILEALGHAHSRGVIHRDLKPDNVLAHPATGRLALTDFGLSHTIGHEATADDTLADLAHTTAGTPEYMAPEQARARFREQGPWTDLYALGCMAHALVTGRSPFARSTPIATLMAHLSDDLPPLVPDFPVPAQFADWLLAMTARHPQDRFRRAADAHFALDALASGFEPQGLPLPASAMPEGDISGDLTVTLGDLPVVELADAIRSFETGRPRAAFARPTLPVSWHLQSDAALADMPGAGLGLYGLRAVPYVGRVIERDRLWRALAEVDASARARAVLVTGPSGAGKSRLCEWLSERAHEAGAAFVLRARSAVVEDPGSGFGPMWRRLFRAFGLAGDELRAHLRWELTRLGFDEAEIAGLGDALFEVVAPEDGGGVVHFATPREAYATMAQVIDRLSLERCVLLWVDDVQWSRQGLDFVEFLLARQAETKTRLLILMTVRPEALRERPDEAARLATLGLRSDVEGLELGSLALEDRPRLIRALLGFDSALAQRVEARTAGNPLFAVQLVGDWVQRGVLEATPYGIRLRAGLSPDTLPLPADLREVWIERVRQFLEGRTSDEATSLELAAALGLHVDADEWAQACQHRKVRPLPDLSRLADALLDAGLAERSPDDPDRGFTFVHGMFREALEAQAAETGARWLATHHRACAEMLTSRAGTAAAERRGRHRLAAGTPADLEDAVEALVLATDGRLGTGEYDAASELLRLGLEAVSRMSLPADDNRRGRLRSRQARLAHMRGDRDAALTLATENGVQAERAGWADLRAEALRLGGTIALDRSHFNEARALLTEAARLALAAGLLGLAGQCDEKLGAICVEIGDVENAEATLSRARAELLEAGDEAGAGRASVGLARLMKKLGRLEEALRHNAQAHDPFEAAGDRNGLATCANQRGELLRLRGDLAGAEAQYREALGLWAAIGAGNVIFARANLGLLLAEAHRHVEARPQLLAAARRFEDLRLRGPLGVCHACLAPCAADAGDLEALDHHLDQAEFLAQETGFADLDAARMLERAGALCGSRHENTRGRRAFSLAIAQWHALKQIEHAASLERQLDGLC